MSWMMHLKGFRGKAHVYGMHFAHEDVMGSALIEADCTLPEGFL